MTFDNANMAILQQIYTYSKPPIPTVCFLIVSALLLRHTLQAQQMVRRQGSLVTS